MRWWWKTVIVKYWGFSTNCARKMKTYMACIRRHSEMTLWAIHFAIDGIVLNISTSQQHPSHHRFHRIESSVLLLRSSIQYTHNISDIPTHLILHEREVDPQNPQMCPHKQVITERNKSTKQKQPQHEICQSQTKKRNSLSSRHPLMFLLSYWRGIAAVSALPSNE